MRCLCTTNVIENPNGAGWTATGFLEADKSFRKIQGAKSI